MDPVGAPEIMTAVELVEDEQGEEESGHSGDVGVNKEILRSRRDLVIKVEMLNIDTKQDRTRHEQDVVDGELLGDGEMESRGTRRGGVESGEGMG